MKYYSKKITRAGTAFWLLLGAMAAPLAGTAKEASPQSAETLLTLSKASAQFEIIAAQLNELSEAMIEEALKSPKLSPEQKNAFKQQAPALREKIRTIVKEELGWERLKGEYIKLYCKNFTQEEMDGIIAFYQSPAGKAFAKKMPQVQATCTQFTTERLPFVTERMKELSAQIEKSGPQKTSPQKNSSQKGDSKQPEKTKKP